MAKNNDAMPTLESWQFWRAAIHLLGAGHVAKIYGVRTRTVYDWATDPSDPTTNKKSKSDPLHRIFVVLKRMNVIGYEQYARAGIDFLESAFSGVVTCSINEVLSTIEEEMLADYPAIHDFHAAVKDGASLEEVERLEQEAIDEIKRTTIRYRKDLERSGRRHAGE